MKAEVRHNEEAGSYSLGFTKDNVFVPVYSLPATQVDTIVASGKIAQEKAAADEPQQ